MITYLVLTVNPIANKCSVRCPVVLALSFVSQYKQYNSCLLVSSFIFMHHINSANTSQYLQDLHSPPFVFFKEVSKLIQKDIHALYEQLHTGIILATLIMKIMVSSESETFLPGLKIFQNPQIYTITNDRSCPPEGALSEL